MFNIGTESSILKHASSQRRRVVQPCRCISVSSGFEVPGMGTCNFGTVADFKHMAGKARRFGTASCCDIQAETGRCNCCLLLRIRFQVPCAACPKCMAHLIAILIYRFQMRITRCVSFLERGPFIVIRSHKSVFLKLI